MAVLKYESLNIKEVKAFLKNVPEDRKVVANGLFSKLEYLTKLLKKLETELDSGEINPAILRGYNETLQRYGIICKQLVSILPKATESFENDPLLNFIKGDKK